MPKNEILLILLGPELFKKKNTAIPWNYSVFGAPEGIRTPGLTLRSTLCRISDSSSTFAESPGIPVISMDSRGLLFK